MVKNIQIRNFHTILPFSLKKEQKIQTYFPKSLISISQKFDKSLKLKLTNKKYLIFFMLVKRYSTFYRKLTLIDIVINEHLYQQSVGYNVSYSLLSTALNHRCIVLVQLVLINSIKSISFIYNASKWTERELYDLNGIFFENHLDLRRLLTDYGFIGHPLRKDFSMKNGSDITYLDNKKGLQGLMTNLTN